MARPKLGESETERLHVKMTAEEIRAIDDWRFSSRMPSRSEAVRRLCDSALKLHGSARQIVAALDEVALRVTDDDTLEPLYRALAPLLLSQLGINSMKDLSIEMQESPAVGRLYDVHWKHEQRGDEK